MNYKKLVHIFEPAAFDDELARLDELSRQGWQLKEHHKFYQKFSYEPNVVYRYAIDCQDEMANVDLPYYLATFEEQGWEHACNTNHWHFFRKRYDPTLPEEEYAIYTNFQSLGEMKGTVQRFSFPLFGLWAVISLMSFLTMPSMCCLVSLLIAVILVGVNLLAALRLRRARMTTSGQPYRRHYYSVITAVLILIWILSPFVILLTDYDGNLYTGPAAYVQSSEFTIRRADWFGINIYKDVVEWEGILSEQEYNALVASTVTDTPFAPAIYTVSDADGAVIASGVFAEEGDRCDLFLRRGTYMLTLDWSSAAPQAGVYTVQLVSHIGFLKLDKLGFPVFAIAVTAIYAASFAMISRFRKKIVQ